MKSKVTAMAIFAMSVLAGPVLAECPANLNFEQKLECITAEDAGYTYGKTSAQDDAVPGIAAQTDSTVSNPSDHVAVAAVNTKK